MLRSLIALSALACSASRPALEPAPAGVDCESACIGVACSRERLLSETECVAACQLEEADLEISVPCIALMASCGEGCQ